MTYHSNDPDPTRQMRRERSRMGGMLLPILFIVIALVIGVSIFAMSRDDRAASTSSTPPATTGQTTPPQSSTPTSPMPSNPAPAQPNPK